MNHIIQVKELGTLSITYRPCRNVKNQTHDIFKMFAGIIHVGHPMHESNFRLLKFTCVW